MLFREATIHDIQQMQIVRHSVKENVLSNAALATDIDCEYFITAKGKGWVCKEENVLIGFAIVDLKDNNIWALFVLPEYEGKGIGKKLHDIMLGWYFNQTKKIVWLSTAPNTRAEKFYRKAGWKEAGIYGTKEIKFEMSYDDWKNVDKRPILQTQS